MRRQMRGDLWTKQAPLSLLTDGVRRARWARRVVHSLARQAGASLLEVSVSLMLIGLMGTGVVGGMAVGGQAAATTNYASIGDILSRSQLDYVAAQPFSPAGDYLLLQGITEGFGVSVQVSNLRPGVLQEITAIVTLPAGPPVVAKSYKTNRLLESGLRPQAAGLEGVRRVPSPPLLGPSTGLYQVIEVAQTEFHGDLRARWRLQATPPKGLSTEARSLSISIYAGTPFGAGPQGFSTTAPNLVVGTLLGSAQASDFVVEAAAGQVPPGTYTVYFFNADTAPAATAEATVQCVCPQ